MPLDVHGARAACETTGALLDAGCELPEQVCRSLRARVPDRLTGVRATSEVVLRWRTAPEQVDADLREQLLACWRDVSNAGGAVDFPFPPVLDEQVRPAVHAMVLSLAPAGDRLLTVTVDGALAGWLLLRTRPSPLTGPAAPAPTSGSSSCTSSCGAVRASRPSTGGWAGRRSAGGRAHCACPSTTGVTRC